MDRPPSHYSTGASTPEAGNTATFTKTKTSTPTRTKTFTPTRTPTPTSTPTPILVCVGTLTSPKLNLQVGCFQKDTQQERVHARITNWGTSPVTLGNLSVKMWVNESQLTNLDEWVALGQLCQPNGMGCVNVVDTGFTAAAAFLSSPCTVDAAHKANQVITFFPNGSTQTILANGGYWDSGLDLGIGRNNPQMDDDWADDYSKTSSCPASIMEDSHFALYYNGTLLQEWTSASAEDAQTGGEPCCGGGVHGSLIVGGQPPASTPTEVPTGAPLATGELASFVFAGPNVVHSGDPVRVHFTLKSQAQVSLEVVTLSGEVVYGTRGAGQAGVNQWAWDQARQAAASGLYLYILRVDDGKMVVVKKGKILLIH